MANNYCMFSVGLDCTKEEADWLEQQLVKEEVCGHERTKNEIILFEEENAVIEEVVGMLEKFTKEFSKKPIKLNWACTCSKPRPDEFFGGAAVIANGKSQFVDLEKELQKLVLTTGAIVPDYVKMAEDAGLVPEDLDDLVHEVMASQATQINNEGLDAQIDYLFGQLGNEIKLRISSIKEAKIK